MKASELVEKLNALIAEHGDYLIEKEDDEGFLYRVYEVYLEPELKNIIVIS